jgi:cation diffusion facilitator family transporter
MKIEKNKVALISVFVAIFLTGFKLIVGIVTGSLGMLSGALYSGFCLAIVVNTFFSFQLSDKTADKRHNYGYGKIENFSALIATILLVITCHWLMYKAVVRLINGNTDIELNVMIFIVIGASVVIDYFWSRALYKAAKNYNNQALKADALHFSTDIWSSAVVLLGLICANFGFFYADSVAALVVVAILLVISLKLGKRATNVLLDKAPEDSIAKVEKILGNIHEITYYHDLMIRESGTNTFISVKIHIKQDLLNRQAHIICNRIEEEIQKVIKRSTVTVHAEPEEKHEI